MSTQQSAVIQEPPAESDFRTRDVYWEHSRNSLGIARLLLHDGRPEPFVATACHAAVENACRAALVHTGTPFDGDLARALEYLSIPDDVLGPLEATAGRERLKATERAVEWIARFLRSEVPERSWGY